MHFNTPRAKSLEVLKSNFSAKISWVAVSGNAKKFAKIFADIIFQIDSKILACKYFGFENITY